MEFRVNQQLEQTGGEEGKRRKQDGLKHIPDDFLGLSLLALTNPYFCD